MRNVLHLNHNAPPTKGYEMAKRVLLGISPNEGYAPDQINTSLTLRELLEAVEEAIIDYGEDAEIVTDNGQRYGAQFGKLNSGGWTSMFYEVEEEEEYEDEEEED